jgi:hypothetical protein
LLDRLDGAGIPEEERGDDGDPKEEAPPNLQELGLLIAVGPRSRKQNPGWYGAVPTRAQNLYRRPIMSPANPSRRDSWAATKPGISVTAVRKVAIGKLGGPTHRYVGVDLGCRSRSQFWGAFDNRHRGRDAGLLPHTPDWMKTMTLISEIVSAPGASVISAMIVGAVIFALPIIILAPGRKGSSASRP